MNEEPKPAGVLITLRDIHDTVQSLAKSVNTLDTKMSDMIDLQNRLDDHDKRIRKMEAQNAAHWVVHTLAVGGIAALIGRIFNV